VKSQSSAQHSRSEQANGLQPGGQLADLTTKENQHVPEIVSTWLLHGKTSRQKRKESMTLAERGENLFFNTAKKHSPAAPDPNSRP
jgi:conjugal transfer/entry exclusion protein